VSDKEWHAREDCREQADENKFTDSQRKAMAKKKSAPDYWTPITESQEDGRVYLIMQRFDGGMAGPYRAYYSNGWWRFEANGINISITPTHYAVLTTASKAPNAHRQEDQ
jgi:hypothetical protein